MIEAGYLPKDYKEISLEFPNLETLNHFSRIVEFVGPMYVQDNHFESRDVLLLVRLFLSATQC